LHPPGRPERSRVAELDVAVPLLVVQGERDPFGRPEEFPSVVPVAPVAAADHSFGVPRTAPLTSGEAMAVVVGAATRWLHSRREWARPDPG